MDPSTDDGWEGDPPSGQLVQAHQGGRAASQNPGALQGGAGQTEVVLPRQTGTLDLARGCVLGAGAVPC